ncbi:MAG: DNA-protecting protein DprA [Actinomycetota bacterium]
MSLAKALVSWSTCTEPGDEAAGMLREALGAERSMAMVLEGSASRLMVALEASGYADQGTSRFGDVTRVLEDSLQRWLPRLRNFDAGLLVSLLESGKQPWLHNQSENWPTRLADLGWGEPAMLWVSGSIESVGELERSIAVVGSRSSTSYGEYVANELVGCLADSGYAVVSGGAMGIDGVAHRCALAAGATTVAVMAGGVDRLYPSANRGLLLEITNKGALVSELPPGASPTKWRFLQRNRLIAAMSQATVVIEAGWRSGSMNTASHAQNLNREVGAFPGPVTSPASAGCHRLIREKKAELVCSGADVLELVTGSSALFDLPSSYSIGQLEQRALDALSDKRSAVSSIAARAGLTLGEAQMALASLQLDSLAEGSYEGWRKTGSNL